MDSMRILVRRLIVVVLIGLVSIVFCFPTAVLADDLPPDVPLLINDLPAPPEDDPVTSPPPDEWVTWPIEEPGLVRPIKEQTGPVRIIFDDKHGDNETEDLFAAPPVPAHQSVNQNFNVLRMNDPASYIFYNYITGFSILLLDMEIPDNK